MRTKLRRAADGAVIDKTFRAGEKFRAVRTESRKMQFLYADGTDAHFMDSQSFDQITIPEEGSPTRCAGSGPARKSTCCSSTTGPPTSTCPAPSSSRSARPSRGQGRHRLRRRDKPATLETGAVVQVPLFVNEGERVRVDTRSGAYVSRA